MLIFMLSSTHLLRRWGTMNVYRFSMALLPPTFGLLPVLNYLARRADEGKDGFIFAAVHLVIITIWALNGLAFRECALFFFFTGGHN